MESTAIALEGPDPFASCDQTGATREYEQILGCSPTLMFVLPETGARRTDRLHRSGRARGGYAVPWQSFREEPYGDRV
jgi:hypothetical protein